MKKTIISLLAVVLMFVLVGCGSDSTESKTESNKENQSSIEAVIQKDDKKEINSDPNVRYGAPDEEHPIAKETNFQASKATLEKLKELGIGRSKANNGVVNGWDSYVRLYYPDMFPEGAKYGIEVAGKTRDGVAIFVTVGEKKTYYAQWETFEEAFAYFLEKQYINEKGQGCLDNPDVKAHVDEINKSK